MIFLTMIGFSFGLIVGSFLNVLIYRHNTGWGIGGRSKCFSCSKTLSARELVPVFSFLVQGARCRNCRSKISWQYPAVECATGVLFALSFGQFITWGANFSVIGLALFVLTLLIMSLLVVITVYDLRHKIIPNEYVYGFVGLALVVRVLLSWQVGFVWLDVLAGPLFAALFGLMWLLSRGTWMGLGDAKLVLGMGFFLGLSKTVTALLFSFWTGALVGIGLLFFYPRHTTMKSEIPFAPFLVFGTLLAYFVPLTLFFWN
jgi:prepilin signal peptidase PulO-like enzyme (type II secretory pathway)